MKIETVTVEILGGPNDGATMLVPKTNGQYGVWPDGRMMGIPIREKRGRFILEWADLETQVAMFEEGREVLERLSKSIEMWRE